MAQDTRITGVYEIKIEQGPALRAFEEVKKKLDNTKAAIRELNKENKALIQQENELTAAIKRDGVATAEQARQLEFVRKKRDELNKKLSEAVITEKGLSAQSRELTNDLAKLTENGLRFRDKMAQATVEALKQTGVLEQLTAKENQLSATLQGVNRALDQNQQELVQLNAAYAKGDKDAEGYKQKQEALNKEIEAGKAAQSLLKTELDQVSGKTNVLEQRVHELNVELNAGKISQQQYREGLQKIEAETAKAGAATGQLTAKFDAFVGGQGAQLKSTLGSLAANYIGVGAAIYGVSRLIGDAARISEDFEAAQSNLAAIMGVSKAAIAPLTEDARRYGATTAFTASQVSDLQTELGKLGFSMKEVRDATPDVLSLAAATGTDLGNAATIAAQTLNAFGLEASETGRIVDVIAKSANLSAFDIDTFSAAMSNAAPSAKAVGVDVERAAAALSLLVDAGIPAEKAGTDLRNIFIELEAKGLTWDEAMTQINGSTNKLSTSVELFGKRSGSSGIIIADNTVKLGELEVAYNDAEGAAAEIAKTQLDNLRGDKLLLTSAWEGFVLSVNDGSGTIATSLRSITQSFTELLGSLTDTSFASDELAKITGRTYWKNGLIEPSDYKELANLTVALRDNRSELSQDPSQSKYAAGIAELQKKIRDTFAGIKNGTLNLDNAAALDQVKIYQSAISDLVKDNNDYVHTLQDAGKANKVVADTSVVAIEATDIEGKSIGDLRKELKQAKSDRDDLNETDYEGLDIANENIKAIEAQIKALEGRSGATKNAAGSVADLNDKISKLQERQSQSTSSDQFATYEAQIKSLSDEVDVLTGKLSREFLDAANAIPERIAPRLPEPQITSGEDVFNTELLGLNPNAPELVGKTLAEVQAVIDEAELNRLSNSMDFNDQLLAVELQWKDGSIQTLQEYEEQRAEIFDRIKEQERAAADARVDITRNSFEVLQEMSDLAFDKKIAQLDAQSSGLNDKLKKATTDEEKARIEGQIKATEAQKTQLEAQKKSQQVFAVAAALIATYQSAQAAYLSQLTIPSPDAPIRAAAAAAIATAAGLINVAKIRGLATGGEVEPSGTVSSTWGTAVNRPNGDNVLVRTQKGFVTLKTGEKVLNDEQQERLERITGRGVWGAIGMPGHAKAPTGSVAYSGFARHYLHQGFAEGGTVGIITPRPTSATIVNNQLASVIGASLDRPIYTDIQEVRSFNSRVEITESARSIG